MDTDDYRCPTCDGRYCPWGVCAGREGDVWVNGRGWTTPATARELETSGRTVQWGKTWTAEKYH